MHCHIELCRACFTTKLHTQNSRLPYRCQKHCHGDKECIANLLAKCIKFPTDSFMATLEKIIYNTGKCSSILHLLWNRPRCMEDACMLQILSFAYFWVEATHEVANKPQWGSEITSRQMFHTSWQFSDVTFSKNWNCPLFQKPFVLGRKWRRVMFRKAWSSFASSVWYVRLEGKSLAQLAVLFVKQTTPSRFLLSM